MGRRVNAFQVSKRSPCTFICQFKCAGHLIGDIAGLLALQLLGHLLESILSASHFLGYIAIHLAVHHLSNIALTFPITSKTNPLDFSASSMSL